MGKVISLLRGRAKLGRSLPKPRECEDCGEDIETARLQAVPKAKRCIMCERSRERSRDRMLSTMRENDIAIIRR